MCTYREALRPFGMQSIEMSHEGPDGVVIIFAPRRRAERSPHSYRGELPLRPLPDHSAEANEHRPVVLVQRHMLSHEVAVHIPEAVQMVDACQDASDDRAPVDILGGRDVGEPTAVCLERDPDNAVAIADTTIVGA